MPIKEPKTSFERGKKVKCANCGEIYVIKLIWNFDFREEEIEEGCPKCGQRVPVLVHREVR